MGKDTNVPKYSEIFCQKSLISNVYFRTCTSGEVRNFFTFFLFSAFFLLNLSKDGPEPRLLVQIFPHFLCFKNQNLYIVPVSHLSPQGLSCSFLHSLSEPACQSVYFLLINIFGEEAISFFIKSLLSSIDSYSVFFPFAPTLHYTHFPLH